MKRWAIVLAATLAMLGLSACEEDATEARPADPSQPTGASTNGPDGRIVFQRYDPSIDGPVTYTVNPDGSGMRPLFEDGPSEAARWSPEGTEIQINCCDDGMAAHLIDPRTGEMRILPVADPDLELHCGNAWSPDGERLACEGYGKKNRALNGVYSIRASDGGDLTRITSNTRGQDGPGDYSPDGTQMVFVRVDEDESIFRLFVTELDGTGLHKISGDLVDELSAGRWSPTGDQILFAGRVDPDHHIRPERARWVENRSHDSSLAVFARKHPGPERTGGSRSV